MSCTSKISVLQEARKAYQTYAVNFRNWSDGTTSGPITSMFNLRNFPTLYLLDEKGVILLKNTSVDAIRVRLALADAIGATHALIRDDGVEA